MSRKIFISRLGAVGEEIIIMTERFVREMFGLDVVRYTPFPEPDYAFDVRRGQYSAPLILQNLSRVCPPDALKFLAVTEADLFIPMVTFVYGQAQLSGRMAIVSLARLSQEFYGLPANNELKTRRSRKEVAHELGHSFGLVHCRDRSCIMSLSTEIQQIDVKSEDFCPGCWAMLAEELARAGSENIDVRSGKGNKVVEIRR